MSVADYPYFAPPPIALAHRGGADFAANHGIENTLAAFTTAVTMGYRYLETDVHASADGRLVAFHDRYLDRVTDRTGEIARLPWREIAAARVGGREPIPTLDDLLEAFADTRINIDIKARSAVTPLWETIRRHAAYDRVCVGSFSQRRLASFRRLAGPRVATAAGQWGVAALRYLPRAASVLAHSPGQVLQIPVRHELGGRTLTLVTPGLVDTVHRFGMHLHVWTIDERDEMRRLLDLGVDGLISDRIDVLRDVLTERGAWPS
ncbi:MAG: glycerophosphodiester phosphodiesterase [Actinomycetales bacterium]|nr:glycerophosphodiester phosphodiesterase [Actinomycetales bacterium]